MPIMMMNARCRRFFLILIYGYDYYYFFYKIKVIGWCVYISGFFR